MLTKEDLVGLGLTPGPLFAKIFKAAKAAKTKEEAVAVAIAIRDGSFESVKVGLVVKEGSVLKWAIENRHWFPVLERTNHTENSTSAIRRMFEQRTMTLNGRTPEFDDKMEFPIWELVFFKGSKRQCTLFCDPKLATWMGFIQVPERGLFKTIGTKWHENHLS